MSKMIEYLDKIARAEYQEPIGFKMTREPVTAPRLQVIAALAQDSISEAAERTDGADAVMLDISDLASLPGSWQQAKGIWEAAKQSPWGGWAHGGTSADMKRLAELGCDFIAFPASGTRPFLLENEEIGMVLEVDTSLGEGVLRAICDLPVDAVLIHCNGKTGRPIVWQDIMFIRRAAGLTGKFLLVFLPPDATEDDLRALWEVGVSSAVLQTGAGQPVDTVKRLREAIDKMTVPATRKREKVDAILPNLGGRAGIPSGEFDEDDDEGEEEEEE